MHGAITSEPSREQQEQSGARVAHSRIVILTSMPPAQVYHFLWRLRTDLPHVPVAGVLYEQRRPKTLAQRLRLVRKHLRDAAFVHFAAHKVAAQARGKLNQLGTRMLHAAHGIAKSPNRPPMALTELAAWCSDHGIAFRLTENIHDQASVEFVAALTPELGVIYGTRILKPQLFSIPRRGTINIHKHQLPDYRGSGPPGLWELRDGKTEQVVTVHRVVKDVDAGAVLSEARFPIDPLDTLSSIGVKADVLGIDCLIDVIAAEIRGTSVSIAQPAAGTVYKGFEPYQMWRIEREISRHRPSFRPRNGRSLAKLAARTLAYPALYVKNRRRARAKRYPVIVLYHHLITDRPKVMGLPTDYFLRHVHYLREHYRIMSLPDAIEMLHEGEVDAPTVVLTFDDGYAVNFLGLRAVAEAEEVPITLFVCTRHVTERSEFQHDLDRNERGFPALGWEELRYLDRHGVCIGSHTRTHFDCGSTDEDLLREEIVGSRDDLRRELGHDVPYFSFPYGKRENMSEAAQRMALETYPYVFSACEGVNIGPLQGGLLLKRCNHPQSLLELELTLQSVLEWGEVSGP